MATYSKACFSAASNGRGIKVAATSTPGTLIHTAGSVTGDDNYDEVYLWAVNSSTAAVKLTIEYGGTTSPDDLIEQTIAPEDGLKIILPGLVVNNAQLVRAFAASANVVMVHGFINEIRA